MGTNWLYVDVESLLQSYGKYPELQERSLSQFALLLQFLITEKLLNGNDQDWSTKEVSTLKIFASDLNEEGKALFAPPIDAYFKWLSANDRDNSKPISIRSLKNGLKKVRMPGTT